MPDFESDAGAPSQDVPPDVSAEPADGGWRRARRPWLKIIVSLVVIALLTAVGVVGLRSRQNEAAPSARAAAAPADVATVLPELERFVERQRGLTFTSPVRPELLDDTAFPARLREVDARDADPAATAASQVSLTALGLLEPGTDLRAQTSRLLDAAVLGFYDPKTKALVVRGNRATPGVRATLAHELTHVLQDQHFNLDRPGLDQALDESSIAFSGLAEGDASLVGTAYEDTLTARERTEAQREQSGGNPPDVPPVLLGLIGFPYTAGPPFVTQLIRVGGHARVDAAFAAPPTSTEQLLNPQRYLAGEGPKPVATPSADAARADEGVLGELGLRLTLQGYVGQSALGSATNGWGGDRYIAWRDGARSCLRDTVVADSTADSAQLRQALTAWSRTAKSKVTIDADSPAGTTFTSCR